jgi:RNA polymerase sigma-70 factor (ECF subfamily)
VAYNSELNIDVTSLTLEEVVQRLRVAPEEETSVYCLEVIRRFEPLLRKHWYRRSYSDDYQDFVHDVFLRLFRGLHNLNEPKALPGYLLKVIFSVRASYTRTGTKRADSKERLEDVKAERIASRADEELLSEIFVRSYLEHLEDKEREVVKLTVLDGYTSGETGKRLGLKADNVRVIKSRALRKLERIILSDAGID